MDDVAGWVAPIATAIAAIMTASNLGTRVTGWGFVVFAAGSVAWIIVALATGQTNLLLANGFLTLINIGGIWRWLGRQATYDKGAHAAEALSEASARPSLFQISRLQGRTVTNCTGETVGHVVDAMAECDSGRISYFVVRESPAAIPERLHSLPWMQVSVDSDNLVCNVPDGLDMLPEIDPAHWPAPGKRG